MLNDKTIQKTLSKINC